MATIICAEANRQTGGTGATETHTHAWQLFGSAGSAGSAGSTGRTGRTGRISCSKHRFHLSRTYQVADHCCNKPPSDRSGHNSVVDLRQTADSPWLVSLDYQRLGRSSVAKERMQHHCSTRASSDNRNALHEGRRRRFWLHCTSPAHIISAGPAGRNTACPACFEADMATIGHTAVLGHVRTIFTGCACNKEYGQCSWYETKQTGTTG